MLRRILLRITYGLTACVGLLLLLFLWYWMTTPSTVQLPEVRQQRRVLPSNAFVQTPSAYEELGVDLLSLESGPPELALPDLQRHLQFIGGDGRPDADPDSPSLHFALDGGKEVGTLGDDGRLYLLYDRKLSPARYVFSPNNTPTPLWIEATVEGDEAVIQVRMRNEEGEFLSDPPERAVLRLKERTTRQRRRGSWELDGKRIDGTLLARQKARWYGMDRFLELVGGEDYADRIGKQRIDLVDDEDQPYTIFVGDDSCLAWIDGRWRPVSLGEQSRDKLLLCLNKVSDRLMNLTLWDVGGRRKMGINVIRSRDMWKANLIEKDFRFVGAKTRRQTIVEIEGQRMTLRPQDWLLYTDSGWEKLNTLEELDAYIEGQLRGMLFIYEGIERRDDQQVLAGTLFNESRSEAQRVELSLGGTTPAVTRPIESPEPADEPVQRVPVGERVTTEGLPPGIEIDRVIQEIEP